MAEASSARFEARDIFGGGRFCCFSQNQGSVVASVRSACTTIHRRRLDFVVYLDEP
jgi:hypothetical protein